MYTFLYIPVCRCIFVDDCGWERWFHIGLRSHPNSIHEPNTSMCYGRRRWVRRRMYTFLCISMSIDAYLWMIIYRTTQSFSLNPRTTASLCYGRRGWVRSCTYPCLYMYICGWLYIELNSHAHSIHELTPACVTGRGNEEVVVYIHFCICMFGIRQGVRSCIYMCINICISMCVYVVCICMFYTYLHVYVREGVRSSICMCIHTWISMCV